MTNTAVTGVLALLAISAVALALAPLVMPPDYSWLSHAISESAAQGVGNAWLARLGLLAFGLAVMWLAAVLKPLWSSAACWLHTAFGVFMTATAAFSHRPWTEGVPFDPIEDWLHSFTATGMGFAFALGVLLRLLQRGKQREAGRVFDAVALVTATAIPLSMIALPNFDGLLQRAMFLLAYVWYALEALRARGR